MAALSTAELDAIREGLAAGKRPRVVFTAAAGQIAGQSGQVVALLDPGASEEWIVVRFGRDELPFSAADLAMPSRNGGAPRAERTAVTARVSPARVSPAKTTSRPLPASRKEAKPEATKPVTTKPATTKPVTTKPVPTKPERAMPETTMPEATRPENGRTSTVETIATEQPKTPRPPKPPKPPATLAVTLAYTDGQWTVAASQGTRTLAKPSAIRAAEALRMVAMIEAPSVHDAVEHIIASERVAAENQAQRLRQELAEIESRLAELRDV